MKILYYDCFSGISGDMNLGALIDLGVDQTHLKRELKKLPLKSYEIKIRKDKRQGITGTRVDVIVNAKAISSGSDVHKTGNYRNISEMIKKSKLATVVKTTSLDIFQRVARAEAKIHSQAIDDVHFHEVGAIDSIVDIVGSAICLDYLKVDKVLASPVQIGGGFVKCHHGVLPVPAPATVEILRGIPVKAGLVPFETTTPTGAAILAATASAFTETIGFTPRKIGYGIGKRDTEIPNVLRVILGEMPDDKISKSDLEKGDAIIVECNIDDMNPEFYDFIMEQLFAAGAHDVFLTPIIMKKSRPAVTISVLSGEARQKDIEDVLLLHSTSFGLRSYKVSKTMLKRETVKVKTRHGEISVKRGYLNGRMIKSKPEYEDCKRLAKEKGLSIQDIYAGIPSKGRLKK